MQASDQPNSVDPRTAAPLRTSRTRRTIRSTSANESQSTRFAEVSTPVDAADSLERSDVLIRAVPQRARERAKPYEYWETAPQTAPETGGTRWHSSPFDAAAAAPPNDQANGTAAASQNTMDPKPPATEPSRHTARQLVHRASEANVESLTARGPLDNRNRSDLGQQPQTAPETGGTRWHSSPFDAAAAAPPNDQANGTAAASQNTMDPKPPATEPSRHTARQLVHRASEANVESLTARRPLDNRNRSDLGQQPQTAPETGGTRWHSSPFDAAAAAPPNDQANGTAAASQNTMDPKPPATEPSRHTARQLVHRASEANVESLTARRPLDNRNRSDLGQQPQTAPETGGTRWHSSPFDAAAAAPPNDQANGTAAASQNTMDPKPPATEPSRHTARQLVHRAYSALLGSAS